MFRLYSNRIKLTISILVLASALLILLLGGAAEAQTTVPPGQAAGPAITSISLRTMPPESPPASPIAGATYFDVEVSIEVSGFNLVEKYGEENVEGEGHIIYYYVDPPTFPFYPAYTFEGTNSNGTINTVFTWRNSPESYDIYAAQLVNNDDTPLNPPVYAMIVSNLLVPGAAETGPAITSFSLDSMPASSPLPSPVPGVSYFDVQISSQISNFEITPADTTSSNAQGQGHYIYYQVVGPVTVPEVPATLDGNYSYSTSANPFTFLNAAPGYHSYFVQLVNNDETPLSPAVYAGIKTNLPASRTSPTPPPATTSPTTPPGTVPEPVEIDLTAQNTAFNLNSISVPAGVEVTINFNNMESGIQHNFAAYTNSLANDPIFVGEIITGPSTTTYSFTAPETPGNYFFRCDVHPLQMFGVFTVTP